ncbi:MAG: phosphoribosyltransferase [Spirochaeta sp.]|jgi:hypoxanthine phosphoribosyltransferase|nr:phosphoribosyltransferase [Spirochaeta sp.]
MAEKLYFSYRQIHRTVKSLAHRILEDGYNPDVIVAIGTGGFIPARMLKTFIDRPILTVGLRLYDENNQRASVPQKIQWIDEVEKKLSGKRILLVDEVDDTCTTLEYCLNELISNGPEETAVAVLHKKRKEKRGRIPEAVSRYWAGEEMDDHWIVYPWDAEDIDLHCHMAEAAL